MSCTNPNYVLYLGNLDGKKKPKFLPKRADFYSLHQLEDRYGKENVMALPCGRCLECRLSYARNWAVRCSLEASYYKFNWFVTLTFDDDHLPGSSKLARREFQLFFKRLRKDFPGVRYFGCCERGERTNRLHGHFVLFNLPLTDVKCIGKRLSCDGYYFRSEKLLKRWKNGLIDLAETNFNTAGYVARYSMKKVVGDHSDEFLMMSTKPPIGYQWLLDHKDVVLKYDKIFFNFGKFGQASLPRAFDKILEKSDPALFEQIKQARLENSNISTFSELISRGLVYREELYEIHDEIRSRKVKRLKRSL